MDFKIDAALEGRICLGVLTLEGVAGRKGDPTLDADVDAYCAELGERYGGRRSGEVPGVSARLRSRLNWQTWPPSRMRSEASW